VNGDEEDQSTSNLSPSLFEMATRVNIMLENSVAGNIKT
jgi:hypothetical protein